MNDQRYTIKRIEKRASDIIYLELGDATGKDIFSFKPGQYVMISYKDEKGALKDKHAFSIASAPTKRESFSLGIKVLGSFTQGLAKMNEGDEIFVSGPFGKFVFDEKKHKEAVLIAGGIGVTPMLSALEYSTHKELPNKMSLIYSNKTAEGTAFVSEIKQWEEKNKNIQSLFAITDEKIPGGVEGVINERVSKEILNEFTGGVEGKTFFLCGPLPFMNAMRDNLLALGVSKKNIEMEEFVMIPSSSISGRVRAVSYAVGFSAVLMMLPFYAIYGSEAKGIKQDPLALAASPMKYAANLYEAIGKENETTGEGGTSNAQKDTNSAKKDTGILAALEHTVASVKKAVVATTTAIAKPVAPTPTTSASVLAAEAASAANQAAQQTTPTPVTSASVVSHTTTQTTQTNAQQTTPTPTTSVSGVVTSTGNQTASNPSAPVTTPTPTTSASGVVSSSTGSTSVSSTNTNTSTVKPTSSHRSREREYDDD